MSLSLGRGHFNCFWHCLLSVPLGRTGLRKGVRLLRPGPRGLKASAPNGTVMCWEHGVPDMVTPAMRMMAVLLFFKLYIYGYMPCSVMP